MNTREDGGGEGRKGAYCRGQTSRQLQTFSRACFEPAYCLLRKLPKYSYSKTLCFLSCFYPGLLVKITHLKRFPRKLAFEVSKKYVMSYHMGPICYWLVINITFKVQIASKHSLITFHCGILQYSRPASSGLDKNCTRSVSVRIFFAFVNEKDRSERRMHLHQQQQHLGSFGRPTFPLLREQAQWVLLWIDKAGPD